jgi:NADH/NAD ratio-sensing transcriptional regulator Rex
LDWPSAKNVGKKLSVNLVVVDVAMEDVVTAAAVDVAVAMVPKPNAQQP